MPQLPPFYKPHEPSNCPARGTTCVVCKEKHHLAGSAMCKETTVKSVKNEQDLKAYQYSPSPSTGKVEVIEISRVCPEDTNNIVQLTINQQFVKFFADSGCRNTHQPSDPLQPSQTKF